MNNINIGYRIKIDNYISTKEDYNNFLNYYQSFFDCSELKVTSKLYNSYFFEYIVLKYLGNTSYLRNFHISKDYIYKFESGQKEEILFSLLNNKKTNLVTHLMDEKISNDLFQNIKYISSIIPVGNRLLLENNCKSKDIFDYTNECEVLSKKLNDNNLQNIFFCLDFGHLLENLIEQGIEYNTYYDYLLKQKEFLKRIKEYHLHDYVNGCDHQIFNKSNDHLNNFKRIFMINNLNNPIILENDISNSVEKIGVEQVKTIKKELKVEK